jgi:hypothetical protein
MRRGELIELALVALALVVSCKTYKDQQAGVPPGYDAATFEAPPGRQVVDDGGVVGVGGATGHDGGALGGGGGIVIGGSGGGGGHDAAASDGAANPDLGPGPVLDGGSAFGGEAGTSCDLRMQTCGANMGCYPAPGGRGSCQRTDPGTPAGSACFDNANCAPGLTCASNICAQLCDTAQPSCPANGRCVPLGAFDGIGYCAP